MLSCPIHHPPPRCMSPPSSTGPCLPLRHPCRFRSSTHSAKETKLDKVSRRFHRLVGAVSHLFSAAPVGLALGFARAAGVLFIAVQADLLVSSTFEQWLGIDCVLSARCGCKPKRKIVHQARVLGHLKDQH